MDGERRDIDPHHESLRSRLRLVIDNPGRRRITKKVVRQDYLALVTNRAKHILEPGTVREMTESPPIADPAGLHAEKPGRFVGAAKGIDDLGNIHGHHSYSKNLNASSAMNIENTQPSRYAKIPGMRQGRPLPPPPSPESAEAVALRLKALRLAQGLEPKEMSKALGLRAVNTWSNWETMVGRPKLDNAIVICRRFGVTLDYIYLGDLSCVPIRLAQQIEEHLQEA